MLADILHKVAALVADDDQPYHPRPSLASPEFPDDPGRCIRQLVYYRTGEPAAPLPGRAVHIFTDGHWHEELTAEWIARTTITLHSRQLPLDLRLPHPIGHGYTCPHCGAAVPPDVLHGHIDGLLTDLLQITRLFEHKAINHFSFQELLSGTLPIDYLTQACLYLKALPHSHPELGQIREAVLLVKNKNTAAYLEYRFRYDPMADRCEMIELVGSDGTRVPLDETLDGLVTSAIAKFEAVETYTDENILPSRPYRQDDWQCGYCRWGRTCWRDYEKEVAARDTVASLEPTLAATLAEYSDANHAQHEGEATVKRLRRPILAALEAANAKAGAVDGHRARVGVQTRSRLDESLLAPDVKRAATVKKTIEVLHVERTTE